MTNPTPILAVDDGKIGIYTESDFEHPVFASDDAERVAAWLIENGHAEWMNSSSMDFANEYGWPRPSARMDVVEAVEQLRRAS